MISAVTGKETAFRIGNAPCSWGTLEFEESKGEQAPAVQSDPPPSVVLADAM